MRRTTTSEASSIPQLAHWQVAPPPMRADDGRPLRYFAGRFYATMYQRGLNPAVTSTSNWSEPDGTMVRRIDSSGETWAEERWGAEIVRLPTAAGIADGHFVAHRGPLFGNSADLGTAADPPGLPEPGHPLPVLVRGLVDWVRARDSRPLIGLRVCATPSPNETVASISVSAWNLPWGAIEFELYHGESAVGQGIAMLSCGPGLQPAAHGTAAERHDNAGS